MKSPALLIYLLFSVFLALPALAKTPVKNTNFIDTPFYLLGEEMRVVNRDGSMRSRRASSVLRTDGNWLKWDWLPPYFEPYWAETADLDAAPRGSSQIRTAYERIEAVRSRHNGYIMRGWGTREEVKAGQVLVREWNNPGSPCVVRVLEPEEFIKRYVNPDGSEIRLSNYKTPKKQTVYTAVPNRAELTEIMRAVYSGEKQIDYASVPAGVLPRLRLEKSAPLPAAEPLVFTPEGAQNALVKTVPLSKVYDVHGFLFYKAPVELAVAPAPGSFYGEAVEKGDLFSLEKINGREYLLARYKPFDVQRHNTEFLPPKGVALSRLVRQALEQNPASAQIRLLRQKYHLSGFLVRPGGDTPKAAARKADLAALKRAFYDYEEAGRQLERIWRVRNEKSIKDFDLPRQFLEQARKNKLETLKILERFRVPSARVQAKMLANAGGGFIKIVLAAGGVDLLFRAVDALAQDEAYAARAGALHAQSLRLRQESAALVARRPVLAARASLELLEEAATGSGTDAAALGAELFYWNDFISQSQIPGTPQNALWQSELARERAENALAEIRP